jgi:hypothetical protein
MVVKTRSYNRQVAAADAADAAATAVDSVTKSHNNRRRVKITTPSFLDASINTYKIYSPSLTPKQSSLAKEVDDEVEVEVDDDDEAMMTTADALVALQDENTQYGGGCITDMCMNPMRPITRFMYCIRVYNSEITLHYKTAYILYDNKTRLYHVYSIISNCVPETAYTDTDTDTDTGCGGGGGRVDGYPAPVHTVQMKYTTYINESIVNYIMTMIVPSNDYDYFIKDDILGIVASKEELDKIAFSEDSSYYDIDNLFHDNTSRETVNGWKTFQLIPSRRYRVETSEEVAIRSPYTESVTNSVLLILSHTM